MSKTQVFCFEYLKVHNFKTSIFHFIPPLAGLVAAPPRRVLS
jgi:hypothetical protein